jgi:hypothetical protein
VQKLTAVPKPGSDLFSGLPHMAGGTIFFGRAGLIFFVAAGTLLMKGVSTFGNFFITFIRVMTFNTRLCIGVLFFGKRVMAVSARYPVSGVSVMGIVIKQYFSRRNVKH